MKLLLKITICIALTISQYCEAQETAFKSRFYTLKNGLSSYNISSIVQDKYGFIWIATQDGLNFFDGTNFKIFNKNTSHLVGGSDIRTIIYDNKNNLVWAAFSYGGVSAIDCQTHQPVIHLTESRFAQVSGTSSIKSIWLTTENELMIHSNKACHIYNKESGKVSLLFDGGGSLTEGQIIQAVADDKNAYYLMVKNKGIIRLTKQDKILSEIAPTYSNHPGSHFSDFSRLVIRKGDTLFFATDQGIAFLQPGMPCQLEWKTPFLADGFSFDKKNRLWYYKENKVWIRDNNVVQNIAFEPKSVLPQTQFYISLFFDRNNNLWTGGSEGLIYSDLSPPLFRKYHGESGNNIKISHLYDLLPSDSVIYLNDLKGLLITNLNNSKTQYIDTSGYPYYLLRMKNGDLLFNNEKGFFLVQDKRLNQELLLKKYPELQKINKRLLACHLSLNDSIIVLGGEDFKGIVVWDFKNHHINEIIPDPRNGWQDNAINALFKKDNKTIIICQDKCISEYDLIHQKIIPHFITSQDGQDTVRLFFDLLKHNDQYIIGTYGQGILVTDERFKILQEINNSNGLSNNSVYRLQKDFKGFLWASTNYGLNRINLADHSVLQYFEKDGLNSDSFEEASSAQQDNMLFFGGLNGFTLVEPGNIEKNKIKPEVYFINYHLKTSTSDSLFTNLEENKIKISQHILQSTFQFASTSYSGPEKIRYFYRITELQKDWIKVEGEPAITLIRLSPGTYHLQVQAFNEDGVESDIKELTLIFLPKWYQTWLFKTLVALTILAIGYALYRMRVNQLRKEEKIRNQLASDLHDDLGSTLNSVKVYSNLALMEKENTHHLAKIKESTQDAIAGVRDLIWVLDDKKDTVQDLLARIGQFAVPLCEANHIKFEQQIDDDLYHYKLGKEEKRNLYMIFKESINNSIKYAACQNIILQVEPAGKKIQFSISDDGKGFEKATTKEGNGLKNIAKRGKEIGYNTHFISSTGKGTTIRLEKT